MILHAAEIWGMLAVCFLVGCFAGAAVIRILRSILRRILARIEAVREKGLPAVDDGPVPLPEIVPIATPLFRRIDEEVAVADPSVHAAPLMASPAPQPPMPFERPETGSVAREPVPRDMPRPDLQHEVGRGREAPRHDMPAVARPLSLAEPRHGRADELTRIRGLGKRHAARLASIGIFHFSQIAAWTPQEVAFVSDYLDLGDSIRDRDWVGQATTLASQDPEPAGSGRRPSRSRSRRGRAKRQPPSGHGESSGRSAERGDEGSDA